MHKRIQFLLAALFLLAAFTFLVTSLNKSNIITALVVQDVNFDNSDQVSATLAANDILLFHYNNVSYSFGIDRIGDTYISYSLNSQKYNLSLRETRNIDLDKDSIPDISVTLDSLLNDRATVTVIRLYCIPNWICDNFGSCINGIQSRNCTDANKCKSPSFVPNTQIACAATCNDGVQNQGETGVDCGGPCGSCKVPANYIYYWAALPIIFAIISIFVGLFVTRLKKKSDSSYREIINANKQKQDYYTSVINKTTQTNNIPQASTENKIETHDDSLIQLRRYIEMALIHDYTILQIKSKLTSAGWTEKIIDENIELVKRKLGKL